MRGDSFGRTRNRGTIVSPGTCNFLVTPTTKQFPHQTENIGKSSGQRPKRVPMYAKLARECQLCVPSRNGIVAFVGNLLPGTRRRVADGGKKLPAGIVPLHAKRCRFRFIWYSRLL